MANKADRFYYQNFIDSADCTCRAASYLAESLANYDPARITDMLESMHAIEHQGDVKRHEMSNALAKAFVTPFDREDLDELSQKIDDVTDCLEEVLQRFYINDIQVVTQEAKTFANKLCECCGMMKELMEELPNYKKSQRLHEIIMQINNTEEECDKEYLQASIRIRKAATDTVEIFTWREIYDYLENCADACEHAADAVGTIVMKNS